MSFFTKDRLWSVLKILFPVTLLLIVSVELRNMFMSIDTHLLKKYLNQLDPFMIGYIVVGGFIAITPMFFYDFILSKQLKVTIPTKKLAQYSLISNSFSNLLGFGGLIGIALRTYFYQSYEKDKRVLLKGIASVTMFYLTGISLLAWIVFFDGWNMPLIQNHLLLFFAVIIVGLILPVIVICFFIRKTKLRDLIDSPKLAVQLIITSLVEWIFVFIYLYSLAVMMDLPVGVWDFSKIFLIAVCAGIVSMIPGGIGSFDLVFLWGFDYLGVPTEKLIVVLLLYRIGYYFLPFIAALLLFIKDLWIKWNKYWSNIPKTIIENISHFFLTLLVFISGIILLVSAALPGILSRLQISQELLSMEVMNFTHHVSVGAGFVLLGLARGIEYREKRTYHLTLLVLIIAALSTFLKGLDYEEALIIIGVIVLLLLSKGRFYRESFVLTWGKLLFDIIIIALFTFGYLLLGYLSLPSSHLKVPSFIEPYILRDAKSLFSSAAIGLFIAFMITVLGHFINKPKSFNKISSKLQEREILEHLHTYQGTTLSHLIFLHDKYVFWNSDKNVLFSYQTYADKLVVLGDPIGEEAYFLKAIEELYEKADIYGYTPVFYETSKRMLPFLHGNGYDFFKLGEEGYVDLSQFSLSGKKMKNQRALKNKFEREGYVVEISERNHSKNLLKNLKHVSDEWLQGRMEKGFSLGFFDESYLQTTTISYVKDPNQQIIAFLTLSSAFMEENDIYSIDLMRSLPNAQAGVMDFLFLNSFECLKQQGIKICNVGMAPLSNLSVSKFSFLSEKIADQIFHHGHAFYHFQGLRNFKNKFCDTWEPRYLGYRKKSSLPFTSVQVTMLVAKKRK
ncbi:bifunctional lysylphosphatidylglycerol flippase/synthetase MprF [Niallia sp. NCCP-28]|uniref:bifunctional lysylphosphatidylglycerol flippase/synthetase MprF n=1 Tax=Niallia sp. NCCP-28 TaxID=2934712 RepID=UPI00208C1DBD|nr:bifunctional lysylphosphatidylglycerol flippase/synthetase MprF [Niallia sp. NCCP-28]GKU82847.1 phosphatidylglycerol lysyltransferase [Niallia sp. NCCP-28]